MQDISTDLKILKTTRDNTINLLQNLTLDQLNTIPKGFNNNLMWNFGHVIVTQQLLCYGLSGLKMYTDDARVAAYRKGTKPLNAASEGEYQELLTLSQSTIEDLEKDYEDELFQEYKLYTTSYNFTLTNIEEAIQFNNVHEALHLGACMAIIKFL